MVHDAEHARAGRPVLALSRTDPARSPRWRPGSRHRLDALPHRRPGARRPRTDGTPHAHAAPALRSAPATCGTLPARTGSGGAGARAGGAAGRRPRDRRGARRRWPRRWRSSSRAARSPTPCAVGRPAGTSTVEVEDGGGLVWHGEPFVVAEGADVARTLDAWTLGADARARRCARRWCSAAPARDRATLGRPDRRAPRRRTRPGRGARLRRSGSAAAPGARPGAAPRSGSTACENGRRWCSSRGRAAPLARCRRRSPSPV